jgi:long-chain acyl-CoA synthetase
MNFMGIYSKNRQEWMVTDWACVLFGFTSVPLLDLMGGHENKLHTLKSTQLQTLFVSSANIDTLLKLDDFAMIKTLVSYDQLTPEVEERLKQKGLSLLYYTDLLKEGSTLHSINNYHIKTKPDDCFTIIHVVGEDGPPKLCMLSHRNVLAFVKSIDKNSSPQSGPNEVFLSFAP